MKRKLQSRRKRRRKPLQTAEALPISDAAKSAKVHEAFADFAVTGLEMC